MKRESSFLHARTGQNLKIPMALLLTRKTFRRIAPRVDNHESLIPWLATSSKLRAGYYRWPRTLQPFNKFKLLLRQIIPRVLAIFATRHYIRAYSSTDCSMKITMVRWVSEVVRLIFDGSRTNKIKLSTET